MEFMKIFASSSSNPLVGKNIKVWNHGKKVTQIPFCQQFYCYSGLRPNLLKKKKNEVQPKSRNQVRDVTIKESLKTFCHWRFSDECWNHQSWYLCFFQCKARLNKKKSNVFSPFLEETSPKIQYIHSGKTRLVDESLVKTR